MKGAFSGVIRVCRRKTFGVADLLGACSYDVVQSRFSFSPASGPLNPKP